MKGTSNRILLYILIGILFSCSSAYSQQQEKPFIKLVEPLKALNNTNGTQQFIIGSTCKSCLLLINDQIVKVYPTGAFAYELSLLEGDTSFTIVASLNDSNSVSKKIEYNYSIPSPAEPVKQFGIESIQTFPDGNLLLRTGDKVKFKVKAYPGITAVLFNNIPLYEMPISSTNGMAGIYQGTYEIQKIDTFQKFKIPITIIDSLGKKITKETRNLFSVMRERDSDIVITKGRLAHLEYGLGDDRLGGAKIGYLDSLIPLKIIGKVGTHYKVQLTRNRTAYIPDEHVNLMPKGTFTPSALTGKWRIYGDSAYDYVNIELTNKLPYQSFQLTDPSKIIVDIFGATNNTNWINQLNSIKEIKDVQYEQIADDIFRITIQLKHHQHWGHQIYYKGNVLVVKLKQQPAELSLKKLTIAIDAGHGGTNTGAGGPTGVAEKNLALALSLKLKKLLEHAGAKVIMTREEEVFFDNKERILFYRDTLPDLLLSIHLNSSADPIHIQGTSTFYRYIGFRPLSNAIYQRMLELGLQEYGNNGSFNFMLNSPTEYPNALIETLFLSNPEEEMKMLNESFQQKMAEKIVEGVKDFLEGCK